MANSIPYIVGWLSRSGILSRLLLPRQSLSYADRTTGSGKSTVMTSMSKVVTSSTSTTSNIVRCDFGTGTDVLLQISSCSNVIRGYPDGAGQMAHFASENFAVFSGTATGALDPTNFGTMTSTFIYTLVQACLVTGAYCLIDIHNYARFIANINTWAATVQAAVTAIVRATSQMILFPGNYWTSAALFVSDGSGPALAGVINPDGSTMNLIFDIYKYLNWDGSGGNTVCVGNQISTAFAPLAQWLRCNTGGSSDPSCLTYLCSAVSFLNANSNVYLGYIGWAAGSFATNYLLGETPTNNNGA
ncbi:hypothetical protein BDZ45DRAFT_704021 [Acephala macrosclerotiorum]|nr:hypothetical protein BDZ45DRAFT_704021 [Acephala macrosclerotiorum]